MYQDHPTPRYPPSARALADHCTAHTLERGAVSNPRWSSRWARVRRLVLARDGYRCQLELPGCTGKATHVDHITPRRFGGGDELANLRAACPSCNLRRGDGLEPVGEPRSAW